MSQTNQSRFIFFILLAIFLISSLSRAQKKLDVIYLKSGGKIIGKIIEKVEAPSILVRLQSNETMRIDWSNIKELSETTIDSKTTQGTSDSSSGEQWSMSTEAHNVSNGPFKKGSVELSLSGSMGSWTIKSPSYSFVGSGQSQSTSYTYIFLTTVLDYYLDDGLSLEPEIVFFAVEKNPPSESVIMNLSYTTRVPHSMIALFVRGGYGLGNSITAHPYGNVPVHRSDKWNINTLNGGAGVKILFNEDAALRVEINYRRQSYTPDDTFYSSGDYTYSNVGLFFGFSVLLH